MNFYDFALDFAGNHPFLTFILICAIYYTIRHLAYCLPMRALRAMNIRKHGWPAAPIDADGDVVWPEKEDKP